MGIVGGAWMFLRDGQTVARSFHGHSQKEKGREVDERTIFHWASITKTFTAVAIMQLRDRGLLQLGDPLVRYVPELSEVHNPFGAIDAITIEHALSHSAGFRGPTWPWGGGQPWHPHEPRTWRQLAAMMPYTQVRFQPGSRYAYSNLAIVFLGRVIEGISGDDYEVYVDKNILKPLEMHHSYFDSTPIHLLPFRSDNYYVQEGRPEPQGLDFDTGITVSNGGLNASVQDMVRYLSFLLGLPDGRAVYDGVLRRPSLESMWRPLQRVEESGVARQRMGLSFFTLQRGGLEFVGHTGWQKGFLSFIYVHPPSGTACLAAVNTLGKGGEPATRSMMYALRERFFERIFPLFAADPE